jgi:hypothetical protein
MILYLIICRPAIGVTEHDVTLPDYYSILGLTPSSSPQQIKRTFRYYIPRFPRIFLDHWCWCCLKENVSRWVLTFDHMHGQF